MKIRVREENGIIRVILNGEGNIILQNEPKTVLDISDNPDNVCFTVLDNYLGITTKRKLDKIRKEMMGYAHVHKKRKWMAVGAAIGGISLDESR